MYLSSPKIKHFKLLLILCLVDAFGALFLILNYITSIAATNIINYLFVVVSIFAGIGIVFSHKLTKLSFIYLTLLIFEIFKFANADVTMNNSDLRQVFSYFYGVIMPFVILTYTCGFNNSEKKEVIDCLNRFCVRYFCIASFFILVYSYFYYTGAITYFGMGVNYNYIFPFIVKSVGSKGIIYCFVFIFLSGKRAPLVTVSFQTLTYFYNNIKKEWFRSICLLTLIFASFIYLWEYTGFLNRWKLMTQVNYQSLSSYDVLILGGGRLEEIIGYFEYVKENPSSFFFGVHALENYSWIIEETRYIDEKNYLHVTFLTFCFRHGILFAVAIYYLLIAKLFDGSNLDLSFKTVCIGIMIGGMFGANLIVDPIAWIFLGLYYNSNISKIENTKVLNSLT
jgi:hypothetical protein